MAVARIGAKDGMELEPKSTSDPPAGCRSLRLRGQGCGGSKAKAENDPPQPAANLPKPVLQTGIEVEPEKSRREKKKVPSLALAATGIEAGSSIDEGPDENALLRETIKASRIALGNTHPSTVTSINNLATMLHDAGKLEEAEALFREALQARRATVGDKDPATITSVNNLGMLLQDRSQQMQDPGRLDEAEQLLREALGARRSALGGSHPETLDSMFNLGRLLQERGRLEEALALLQEELDGAAAHKGRHHPETLESAEGLRALLVELFLGQAEASRKTRIVRYARIQQLTSEYALDEAAFSGTMSGEARLLGAPQELPEASVSAEGLEASRKTFGSAHPSTLSLMNDLASKLYTEGQLQEAAALFSECLQARRAVLGERDPATLTSINNLGMLLQDQGQLDEATKLLTEALDERRKVCGPLHPETLDSLFNLAALHKECGRLAQAAMLLREELDGAAARKGKMHPETLESAASLHALLLEDEQEEQAEALGRAFDVKAGMALLQAAAWREQLSGTVALHGKAHPETLMLAAKLHALLLSTGQHESEEAAAALTKAYDVKKGKALVEAAAAAEAAAVAAEREAQALAEEAARLHAELAELERLEAEEAAAEEAFQEQIRNGTVRLRDPSSLTPSLPSLPSLPGVRQPPPTLRPQLSINDAGYIMEAVPGGAGGAGGAQDGAKRLADLSQAEKEKELKKSHEAVQHRKAALDGKKTELKESASSRTLSKEDKQAKLDERRKALKDKKGKLLEERAAAPSAEAPVGRSYSGRTRGTALGVAPALAVDLSIDEDGFLLEGEYQADGAEQGGKGLTSLSAEERAAQIQRHMDANKGRKAALEKKQALGSSRTLTKDDKQAKLDERRKALAAKKSEMAIKKGGDAADAEMKEMMA